MLARGWLLAGNRGVAGGASSMAKAVSLSSSGSAALWSHLCSEMGHQRQRWWDTLTLQKPATLPGALASAEMSNCEPSRKQPLTLCPLFKTMLSFSN